VPRFCTIFLTQFFSTVSIYNICNKYFYSPEADDVINEMLIYSQHKVLRNVRLGRKQTVALPCLALPCLALPCLALPCLVFKTNIVVSKTKLYLLRKIEHFQKLHSTIIILTIFNSEIVDLRGSIFDYVVVLGIEDQRLSSERIQ
jgi:hypothetical protein